MNFKTYITKKQQLILETRQDITPDNKQTILDANSPFELTPKEKTNKGCLLIHGLYDSPFTMRDIADHMVQQGFLTRAILLPGHGTNPQDLHEVNHKDWQQEVIDQIISLEEEVDEITLIGFSTGAALAMHYALESHDHHIKKLILIAPAIELASPISWALAFVAKLSRVMKPCRWLKQQTLFDYARYTFHSLPAANQVYQLGKALKKYHLETLPESLFIIADTDFVVSSTPVLALPKKHQIICYSNKALPSNEHITYRQSAFPEQDIIDYSHLALPISPENIHYGKQPNYIQAIEKRGSMDKTIMKGEATTVNLQKHHIVRLTYNPDFEYMMERIRQYLR